MELDSDDLESIESQIAEIDGHMERLRERREELAKRRERLRGELAARENDLPVDQFLGGNFPWTTKIRSLLHKKFGYQNFRGLQEAALNALLSGNDCTVVMPAGSGKSLIYQLAAMHLRGLVFVVTPLTSLMEDQLMSISARDPTFPAFGVHINLSKEDLNHVIVRMSFQQAQAPKDKMLLFVTPDKINKSKQFMAKVSKAYDKKMLALIVIDEAQCCASQGHDFRSDYQALSTMRASYPGVPMLLLTSTASKPILFDMACALNLEKRVLLRQDLDMSNIAYEVNFIESGRQNVIGEIARMIQDKYPNEAGMVCCFSVKDAEDVATVLVKDYSIKAKPYHHQLKMEYRSKVHKQWASGKIQIIVATTAFGMGIHKSDCRFVVHYSISKSLQNYYIESGRAGRDGRPAQAYCMFKFQDVFRLSSLVFSDKSGLRYLYRMIRFCLDKDTCRRQLLRETLTEGFADEPIRCRNEEAMCDNCRNPVKVQILDVTEHIKLFSTIFEEQSAQGQRVTGWKLMDLFGKRLNKENAPYIVREHVGHLIAWALCEGYLEEKFHFTPYSTISHLAEGPRLKRLLDGRETAEFKVYTNVKRQAEAVIIDGEEGPTSKVAKLNLPQGNNDEIQFCSDQDPQEIQQRSTIPIKNQQQQSQSSTHQEPAGQPVQIDRQHQQQLLLQQQLQQLQQSMQVVRHVVQPQPMTQGIQRVLQQPQIQQVVVHVVQQPVPEQQAPPMDQLAAAVQQALQ